MDSVALPWWQSHACAGQTCLYWTIIIECVAELHIVTANTVALIISLLQIYLKFIINLVKSANIIFFKGNLASKNTKRVFIVTKTNLTFPNRKLFAINKSYRRLKSTAVKLHNLGEQYAALDGKNFWNSKEWGISPSVIPKLVTSYKQSLSFHIYS